MAAGVPGAASRTRAIAPKNRIKKKATTEPARIRPRISLREEIEVALPGGSGGGIEEITGGQLWSVGLS
jgi:hypothetical protein